MADGPGPPSLDENSWIYAKIDTNLDEILLFHLGWNSIIIIASNFS